MINYWYGPRTGSRFDLRFSNSFLSMNMCSLSKVSTEDAKCTVAGNCGRGRHFVFSFEKFPVACTLFIFDISAESLLFKKRL